MKNQKKQTLKMDLPFLKNDITKNLHTLIFTVLLRDCRKSPKRDIFSNFAYNKINYLRTSKTQIYGFSTVSAVICTLYIIRLIIQQQQRHPGHGLAILLYCGVLNEIS